MDSPPYTGDQAVVIPVNFAKCINAKKVQGEPVTRESQGDSIVFKKKKGINTKYNSNAFEHLQRRFEVNLNTLGQKEEALPPRQRKVDT